MKIQVQYTHVAYPPKDIKLGAVYDAEIDKTKDSFIIGDYKTSLKIGQILFSPYKNTWDKVGLPIEKPKTNVVPNKADK